MKNPLFAEAGFLLPFFLRCIFGDLLPIEVPIAAYLLRAWFTWCVTRLPLLHGSDMTTDRGCYFWRAHFVP
nr:hypothetical protein [Buttiauxella sp. BIGb0471]